MVLPSQISFAVVLMLIPLASAGPAYASGHRSDPFNNERRTVEKNRDRHGSREHGDHERHRRRSEADFPVMTSIVLSRPQMGVPFLGQNLRGPVSMPFLPPAQFRYYCDNPPGWFPAVATCAGPWLETGAQPSP